ncbi:MAG: acetyl-CoA carboxylase biotin carboxyl carrier protein [Deltaproteobacteria bacterium]|nr:acetyl-CoA carboxylase biotin carboxyl carrier protein [Deltaproteobacteria bacterium]
MDLQRLETLLDLLIAKNVSEFSYEDEEVNLSLRIGGVPVAAAPVVVAAPSAPVAAPSPAAQAPTPPPGHVVSSPMVGTFYRSASPDAPPYAELGASVRKGQVLCIIEAMKLMNEIESDADGVVVEILAQNGQPVQFGQPLFRVRS